MKFQFRDSMCTDYWQQGYVVFRRILPASLVRDLRVEADKIRVLAHELAGPGAQRLQPVIRHGDRLNLQPFRDYAELPELRDAVQKLLGPAAPGCLFSHTSHRMEHLGVLVEPTHRPRLHGWHRDGDLNAPGRVNTPDEIAAIAARRLRPTCDNQVNCAIYPDPCLWYVPGSHLRVHNLPGETPDYVAGQKNPFDQLEGSHAEIERACLEGCYRFPGAIRLGLDPGDYAIYRSSAWHNGLYLPTQPRATIHDVVEYSRAQAPAEPAAV